MNKIKVLIKDYKFSKDDKIVTFLLEDLDKEEGDEKRKLGIAVLFEEIGPLFGIGVIETKPMAKRLLDGAKGKRIYLELHPKIKEFKAKDWKGISIDDVLLHHNDLDYFPYYEVLTDMAGEADVDND